MPWLRRYSSAFVATITTSRVKKAVVLSALSAAMLACAGEPPRHAKPTTPIPEARAVEILRRAVRAEKQTPNEGRDIDTTDGAKLHIDVGIEGKKFGIAYVTESDLDAEGASKLPKHDTKALVLARGASKDEADTLVVLFFAREYRYDDQSNSTGDYTLQAVEGRLEQDARDFVTRAKLKKFE
jgi:hypothetical protein